MKKMIKTNAFLTRLVFCSLPFLLCCNSDYDKKEYSPEVELRAAQITDSIVHDILNKGNFDTLMDSPCPVAILSSKLVKKEYSNYKDIFLTYKNQGQKDVEGIKFKWYGETVFGEPADMGSSTERGFGGGFSDDKLKIGRSDDATYAISSRDAKKIVKVWVTEVVFTDGTKWQTKSN